MGPRSCRSDEAAREITWALRLASKEHHAAVMCRQFSKNGEAVYPLIRRSLQALSKGHRRGGGSAGGRGPRARDSTHMPPPDQKTWLDPSRKKAPPTGNEEGPTPSDWALAGFLPLEKMIGQRRTERREAPAESRWEGGSTSFRGPAPGFIPNCARITGAPHLPVPMRGDTWEIPGALRLRKSYRHGPRKHDTATI